MFSAFEHNFFQLFSFLTHKAQVTMALPPIQLSLPPPPPTSTSSVKTIAIANTEAALFVQGLLIPTL